jgi:hypothetical protein
MNGHRHRTTPSTRRLLALRAIVQGRTGCAAERFSADPPRDPQ